MPKRSPTEAVVVALLRGVNVGGKNRVSMTDLRRLASGVGCRRVETYVQSGNLVVVTHRSPEALEAALEQGIVNQLGLTVPVVARSAHAFRSYAAGSPFSEAERDRPNLLHLALAKHEPAPGALVALAPYAKSGERLSLQAGALWIDFVAGVARSKLTAAVLDRALGSTVTMRNWRTVQKLAEMAAPLE